MSMLPISAFLTRALSLLKTSIYSSVSHDYQRLQKKNENIKIYSTSILYNEIWDWFVIAAHQNLKFLVLAINGRLFYKASKMFLHYPLTLVSVLLCIYLLPPLTTPVVAHFLIPIPSWPSAREYPTVGRSFKGCQLPGKCKCYVSVT